MVSWAERKAGEMLRDMEKNVGGRPTEDTENLSHDTTGYSPTLPEIGISRDQSSKWQRLAAIPEEDFEAYIKKHSHGKVGLPVVLLDHYETMRQDEHASHFPSHLVSR